MHAKGLPFEEHRLDLFAGDQLKPGYLRINPNGVVPARLHQGAPVIESSVIMEYLEDIRPGAPTLRPTDPLALAAMRAAMRFIDEVPTPAVRVPSYNLAFLPHFQAMSEATFQALCDSKPLRREFLMRMGRTGFPESEMNEAIGRLARAVRRMAEWLEASGGPWIMGPDMTLADVALMPVIVRMDDIVLGHIWDAHPRVASWLDSIRETLAFRPTFYHGTLLTEKYPHLAALRPKRTASCLPSAT
jgi:glutathione S-transferase